MKREPSIHITKTVLRGILNEIFNEHEKSFNEKIANTIFHKAKAHSLHTRTITVSTDKMEKKAKRLVQSSRRDADLLAQLIHKIRQTMRHRGISSIKPGSRDWGVLKEITAQALDFTNEFNLTRRYGFLKYIEIGLSKMKKFGLNKFLNMYQGICETYQAMVEIEKDADAEMTKEMYKAYAQKIIQNTGIHDALEELPERYVWFVRAREQAKSMNIGVKIYIEAQFDGLDFSKGIPHPTQLVGPKATERVIRYCYKTGVNINGK